MQSSLLTNNENYYSLKDIQHNMYYTFFESKQRQKLRKMIKDQLTSDYKNRFDIFICTPKDVERLMLVDEGRGNLGINMTNGKSL